MSSSRAEELATQFEARRREFVTFIGPLTDEQWLTLVPNEQRTVASLAHHIAWGYRVEIEPFQQIALGNTPKAWTLAELDAVNAELGPEFAECDKQEMIDLLDQTAAETAAIIRSLTDEQLTRRGTYIAEMGEDSVESLIERILLGHIAMHRRSIQEALRRNHEEPGT
jgi:DinB superfamily